MKRLNIFILTAILLTVGSRSAFAQKTQAVAPSFAWDILPPLGLHQPTTIDTLYQNYAQRSVPTDQYLIYATTGNLGGPGINMDYMRQLPTSQFFFRDAMANWRPVEGDHTYYNTRIPMTLLGYNTGGGRENKQDRLTAVFSGNVNARLQFGANMDYLYSKGSYNYQAVKNLTWGLSSSYMGDRYELQTFFNHWNGMNQENGGITDDLYITDPAQLQGGESSIDARAIPTNLTQARNRLKGQEFYMNHRYKIGFWRITPPNDTIPNDTVEHRTYVPVTSFIWTMDYRDGYHNFFNGSESEAKDFWQNQYMTTGASSSPTSYWSLSNTLGVSLLEGFNKYAKAGLSAYVTHEIRRFTLCPDTIPFAGPDRPEGLTPYPFETPLGSRGSQNLLWVGGQLTKQQGSLLRYEATAKFGVVGDAAGEIYVDGNIQTRFKLLGDSVRITGYGRFSNENAPYMLRNYVSNHFIWQNDFSKTRRVRFGGELFIGKTSTRINVGVENIQNLIYFNEASLPVQNGGSVQILSASLNQNLRFRSLHWDNRLLFQTSSDKNVVSLPAFAAYSNLYLQFKVARVLDVQLGVDCDFYTKYYAPGYQPATMSFHNQRDLKTGGYPFMNLYANMKLSKARFYIMMSHINQGMTGRDYFFMPHYPMNPRRFQMGVSVDFAD